MNRLWSRAVFLVVAAWGLIGHSGAIALAAERPNVLLICVDDLKPVLGCYGDTRVRSPNIDRLAARGMRLDAAYCNQAVCSPSRNALLTSLRPQSLGIYDLGTNFRKAVPNAVTLPQRFKNEGYQAEGLGKIFHVGHGNNDDKASWTVPHWKSDVVAYALPESRAKEGLTREEALFKNQAAQGLPKGAAYESADVPDSAYPDGAVADEAIRRLQAAKGRANQPFFLAVGFVKPHLPFCAPKKYWDLYDRASFEPNPRQTPPDGAPSYAPQFGGELRQYRDIPDQRQLDADLQRTWIHGYYAAVSYMDAQVGRLLAALDEQGFAKNTIIVLWGDHGWHLGDHGMWCKHTNYEQATRIPLIVVAPGVTAVGSRSAAPIETVDIYPTLCELAGITAPESIDGISFAATLRDASHAKREFVTHVYPRGQRLGRAIRTARYRLVEWKEIGAAADTAELELYDYESDPAETKNLAADRTEVVAQLRALLSKQPEAKKSIAKATAATKSDAKSNAKNKNKNKKTS